jgi:DNA-binding LacI/PurR family transcriptional regulator
MEMAGGSCRTIPIWGQDDAGGAVERMIVTQRVTALWSIHDHDALCAYGRLHRAGLRVPGGDLSIVGRNDTPWATQGPLPLTSVSLNPAGVASAVTEIVERTREARGCVPGTTLVKPHLVVRDSTAPAPAS